jgi:hypothetical protein
MVRQIALPPNARSLSTLPHVDYEECFVLDVDAGEERSGEQWARAMVEDSHIRSALTWSWFALGLKLGSPRSDRLVLGWELRRSTPGYALLGAGSRIGMPAELLFKPERDRLLFATFVQHKNPVARALWAAVAPRHRRVVRHLLRQARSSPGR